MSIVTLREGPYGTKVAEVSPPFEFLGEFLTAEGSSSDSWACKELFAKATAVRRGDIDDYRLTGDAHEVEMTSAGVIISSVYRQPPARCVIPADVFLAAIEEWKRLLKHSKRE